MDIEEKIELIMEWADSGDAPDNWDTSFVESLSDQFDRDGYLSEKQEAALDNIITKWNIMQ